MVARQIRAQEVEGDQQPGMGIDFFALSMEAKKVWDHFVLRSAAAGDGDTAGEGTGAAAPTRRKYPRNLSCFLVQLKDRDRLREFFTRDISTGGMFLRTPAPNKVSERVELIIVHPETREEFPIQGVVVRVVTKCALVERGVGIQFEPMTPALEAALVTFIESGANFLERGSLCQEERIERLGKAAAMVGDSVSALMVLGNALLEEMDAAGATKTLERALVQQPDDLGIHQGLFKAYNMMGDLDRAGRHLDAVRRLEGS